MVSVYYILKDEQDNIRQSIESVRGFASEIVVVDTGSTDKTMDIVREFGITPYEIEWTGHADARNYAISKCNGDWIFTLDGDEIIINWEEPNEKYDFANVIVTNKIKNRFGSFRSPRLFRNHRGVKFTGAKQAMLDLSLIEHGLKGYESNTEILHFGYDLTEAEQEIKNKENLSIHLGMLDTEPDNLVNKYYIAQTYFGLKDYQNAVKFGALAIDDPINRELKACLCNTMFLSYNFLGELSIGKLWLKKSLDYMPLQVLGRTLAMQVYKNDKDIDNALHEFKILEVVNEGKLSRLPNDCYYTETEIQTFKTELENAV